MNCWLCNEPIEDIEIQFGEIEVIDGEYWHAECFEEYFEDALNKV